MTIRRVVAGLALGVALLAAPARAGDVTKVPAFDQFLVVPLRIHVLNSPELSLTNARIGDAAILKSLGNINAIWCKAGVAFCLESIVREPADQVERFSTIVKLSNGQLADVGPFGMLLPRQSRAFDGVHLYLFSELPYNGFCLPTLDAALVLEAPRVREVRGGSSDFLARVAARFLGEAIGLAGGRDDEVGLASGGTNGVGLSESEIGRVRQLARLVPGVVDADDALKAADSAAQAQDNAQARRLLTTLAAIPGVGPGAGEAKKKLAALPAR